MSDIQKFVTTQIEIYNETADNKVDLSNGVDTVLFGAGSVLDSVDFVSLIIDIEQAAEEEFGKSIALSDARAMSQKNSPFRTIGTLSDYIAKLLEE